MPRNSGTYTLPAGNPVVSGTAISSTVQNNTMNDIGNEITNSIPRDGSAPPTNNIPMGNFKITGIGAGTLAADVPQLQQIQSGLSSYLTAVSGTNAIIGTLSSPALSAYVAGNVFVFTSTGTNTGAATININAIGAKTINKDGAALVAGDIVSGRSYEIIYDGTNFNLISGAGINSSSIQNQTYTYFTTGGTSTAYTLTPSPAVTALAAGQLFLVNFNATAGATPTLAVSGLTAKNLKYYDSTGNKQAITASVAANALTITLNPTSLDFRSATLGSGVVNTRTISAAISLVISSGSTLGTVNGIQSRIAVIAIDNSGALELAAVNIAGGNDLSETGLITTVAEGGGGAADSSNVIYSNTARTNVPYRVVGYVESTQATAGTWATAPSTIQGVGGQALTALSSLGCGQTWQGVTRTASTTYYNTTGKPIYLNLQCNLPTGGTMVITINGVNACSVSNGNAATQNFNLGAIIPVGASYSSTGNTAINVANELR
jgi:hypothetical protein